jgi:hypothetical protein
VIAYKFLRTGRRALITRASWPEPSSTAAAWVEASSGELVPCRNGIHACRVEDLAYWIAEELWEVELSGETRVGGDSILARKGRLVRPVEAWRSGGAAPLAFARGCIERAETHVDACGVAPDHLARSYAQQARQLENTSYLAALSHAAALAFALTQPPSAAKAAFRAERAVQGKLLAEAAGLPAV